ncbi:co-chaperone DjlA [Kaarinaea lacus]
MWGKLIGAISGYLIAGPVGLLVGVILGHQIDRRLSQSDAFAAGHVSQAQIQQAFFEATFSVMGSVAKADGRVSEEEISLAREIMTRMGLSEASRLEAIKLFTAGKQADFPLETAVSRFHYATRRAHNLRQLFIEIQLHAAYADGDLNESEREVLLLICEELGFSVLDFERLDAMIQAEQNTARGGNTDHVTLKDAYAILNIRPDASDSEVKRAYRRLMNQHHPDKLVAKGLPQEMMKLAEQKTHEIRIAYESIQAARGLS